MQKEEVGSAVSGYSSTPAATEGITAIFWLRDNKAERVCASLTSPCREEDSHTSIKLASSFVIHFFSCFEKVSYSTTIFIYLYFFFKFLSLPAVKICVVHYQQLRYAQTTVDKLCTNNSRRQMIQAYNTFSHLKATMNV